MARARNIKPGFFKNEELAECSPLARLLFAGLWTIADRDGRLEDRPKRIRAEILPYDEGSVDDMLTELASAGFILRYESSGNRYIQVTKFVEHQNPHCKEQASTIPAPDITGAGMVEEPNKNRSCHADSPIPITDSLKPITDSKVEAKPEKTLRGSRLASDWIAEPEFVEFCKTERPDLDSIVMQNKFRDYWSALPGKAGSKTDWLATWRNFIRSERGLPAARASPGYQTKQEKTQQWVDKLIGKNENERSNNIIDV